ncbi:hypothetical protein QZH41_002690 [Actinostola sp. cb2023]|nr:hypothetical protein QZH41_002690 [Actinostola sp. cb2023]
MEILGRFVEKDSKLDSKFEEFKRKFSQQESASQSEIKKLKLETKAVSSFKHKGNRLQYEFNVNLLGVIEQASSNLLEAVEEYESDDLADDSEDEKKLRSAEKRALSKIKTKKQAQRRPALQSQASRFQPSPSVLFELDTHRRKNFVSASKLFIVYNVESSFNAGFIVST